MNLLPATQHRFEMMVANLKVDDQKYVAPALGSKLQDVAPQTMIQKLARKIQGLFALAGQKPDANDVVFQASEFYKIALKRFPAITLDEIDQALTNGFHGDYGDYFGLNTKTFMIFIKEYYQSPERIQALKKFNDQLALPVRTIPTADEIRKSNRELCEILYADFLANKLKFEFIPPHLFDFLITENGMECNDAEFEMLKRRAANYYDAVRKDSRNAKRLGNHIRDLWETDDLQVRFSNLAKSNAVYNYFEDIRELQRLTVFL